MQDQDVKVELTNNPHEQQPVYRPFEQVMYNLSEQQPACYLDEQQPPYPPKKHTTLTFYFYTTLHFHINRSHLAKLLACFKMHH